MRRSRTSRSASSIGQEIRSRLDYENSLVEGPTGTLIYLDTYAQPGAIDPGATRTFRILVDLGAHRRRERHRLPRLSGSRRPAERRHPDRDPRYAPRAPRPSAGGAHPARLVAGVRRAHRLGPAGTRSTIRPSRRPSLPTAASHSRSTPSPPGSWDPMSRSPSTSSSCPPCSISWLACPTATSAWTARSVHADEPPATDAAALLRSSARDRRRTGRRRDRHALRGAAASIAPVRRAGSRPRAAGGPRERDDRRPSDLDPNELGREAPRGRGGRRQPDVAGRP